MGTSYSKLRHIQEANLRLEQEHLFELRGNYKAKRAGTKANIQARLQNVGGTTKLMQNPKLQGLLAQVKSRKSTLDKQLTYLNTELNNVLTEVEQLKTTRPDFAPEAGQLETVIKTYQTAIATMLEAGKPIETFAYQAAPTTTTQTTQVQQTTETQSNILTPEEQEFLKKYPGMTLDQAKDAEWDAANNNPMNYNPDYSANQEQIKAQLNLGQQGGYPVQ
jgi:chromosome segregation ATPase